MESIKIWVENLISMMGVTGDSIPVIRHISLVLVAILLSALAGLICKKVLVPVILKLTAKTEAKWDDVLFNEQVLVSACHIVPAIVIWQLLPLVFYQFPVVRELLTRITAIYIVVMSVKTALVFLDAIKKLEGERRSNKQQYLYSFIGVVRLLLMFIFQNATYGVLGRMIALSAIISFVVLYLFTRITITCAATIENKR